MEMRCELVIFGLVTVCVQSGSAAVLHVPAQYSTIQAAIDVAAADDSILVAPGVYREHLILTGRVTLLGGGGPTTTILDGGNTGRVLRGNGFTLSGFTVRNGLSYADGAGLFGDATVENCIFQNNSTGSAQGARGGAVFGARMIRSSVFESNYAKGGGGAIWTENSTIEGCTFRRNWAGDWGGAIRAEGPTTLRTSTITDSGDDPVYFKNFSGGVVEDCLVLGNSATTGAIRCFEANPAIRRCTFADNGVALYLIGAIGGQARPTIESCTLVGNNTGVIAFQGNILVTLSHCLFVDHTYAYRCLSGGEVQGNCNHLWNIINAGGSGCGLGQVSEGDPRFCDVANGNFMLDSASPCLPRGACGQIGAWGVGCGAIRVEPRTWTQLKLRYSR